MVDADPSDNIIKVNRIDAEGSETEIFPETVSFKRTSNMATELTMTFGNTRGMHLGSIRFKDTITVEVELS